MISSLRKLVHMVRLKSVEDQFSGLTDLPPEMINALKRSFPYTMTSVERLAALCLAVDYVVHNNIAGAFVECGVWKGGSSMAAAMRYMQLGRENVPFYLFDTFEGMSQPSKEDIRHATGETAEQLLATSEKDDQVWARASLDEVKGNLRSTGYPESQVHFIKGMVESTIPVSAPERISILRLDTDWYESTRHELVHLFPRLSKHGVLIIDDYGHWAGARKAVDEFFAGEEISPLLLRIDNTGRICTKQ